MLPGVEYPLSHLMDVTERIDWQAVRILGRNLAGLRSDAQIEQLGREALRSAPLRVLTAMARYVFTPIEYYGWAARELTRYCVCIDTSMQRLGPLELECRVQMLPGYAPVREIFVALQGAFASMTEVYGRQPADVEMCEEEGGACYRIRLRGQGFPVQRLRAWLTWGTLARSAARELRDAHELLYERHLGLLERDARLRESERMHRDLVEQAFDPILIADRAGHLLHANQRACELFGEPLEALLERAPGELITVPGEELRRFLHGLRDHRSGRVEGLARRANGTTLAVEIGCTVLSDGRVQAVLRDIGERRRIEQEMERYAGELELQVAARTAEIERANTELRDLQARLLEAERMRMAEAAAVRLARSINNPLTALIGTLEMAAERPSDAPQAVRQGLRLARRMRATLAEDLDASDGREGSRRGRESVEALLEDLETALAPLAHARGVRMELKVEPGLPAVAVDRALFGAALVALGTNGIEAMDAGQTLGIEAERLSAIGVVQFRVIDEGVGIPKHLTDRVLEPYFSTKGARAGLGLPIALAVAQGHGGRLRIEERPGGGTLVTLEIEAAPRQV